LIYLFVPFFFDQPTGQTRTYVCVRSGGELWLSGAF